jgi:argininosuccinate lyase
VTPAGDKLWGGRFEGSPDEAFFEFQRSFGFDRRLLPYELAVDRAWAHALERIGILSADETKKLLGALDQLEARAKSDPAWLASSKAEDVHHFVEMELVKLLGPWATKIHTGRSRNELIVTDFRMFIKDAAREMRAATGELIGALVSKADEYFGIPMPGNTHMQHAQPILFSHWLLAHAEAFFHDLDRIAFAANTADACPMGSGALAGCSFPVDRRAIADELGFARVTRNSLDSVSRRDFALDYLFALAVLAQHHSRMAEDFVLFASQEFGFIVLPDAYSTGSSLMPQKKNPDAWELIRGKCGRITAALVGLLATLKGLPTGYQRDLQEDKEPIFAAHDQALAITRIAAAAVAATRVNRDRVEWAARSDSMMLATEAADYFVRKGVPFREAHELAGRMVREAETLGKPLTELPESTLKSIYPQVTGELRACMTLDAAIASKSVPGGTAPDCVRAAIADCRARLARIEGAS